jgi:hypothetical protein
MSMKKKRKTLLQDEIFKQKSDTLLLIERDLIGRD